MSKIVYPGYAGFQPCGHAQRVYPSPHRGRRRITDPPSLYVEIIPYNQRFRISKLNVQEANNLWRLNISSSPEVWFLPLGKE